MASLSREASSRTLLIVGWNIKKSPESHSTKVVCMILPGDVATSLDWLATYVLTIPSKFGLRRTKKGETSTYTSSESRFSVLANAHLIIDAVAREMCSCFLHAQHSRDQKTFVNVEVKSVYITTCLWELYLAYLAPKASILTLAEKDDKNKTANTLSTFILLDLCAARPAAQHEFSWSRGRIFGFSFTQWHCDVQNEQVKLKLQEHN